MILLLRLLTASLYKTHKISPAIRHSLTEALLLTLILSTLPWEVLCEINGLHYNFILYFFYYLLLLFFCWYWINHLIKTHKNVWMMWWMGCYRGLCSSIISQYRYSVSVWENVFTISFWFGITVSSLLAAVIQNQGQANWFQVKKWQILAEMYCILNTETVALDNLFGVISNHQVFF